MVWYCLSSSISSVFSILCDVVAGSPVKAYGYILGNKNECVVTVF